MCRPCSVGFCACTPAGEHHLLPPMGEDKCFSILVFYESNRCAPSSLTAWVHWPWRRLRAPGWWSRRGLRACKAADWAFPLCPSSPAAGSYRPRRASLWSEGWSGGRRQSAAWCCSRSTSRSETCREGAQPGLDYQPGKVGSCPRGFQVHSMSKGFGILINLSTIINKASSLYRGSVSRYSC